MKSTVELPLIVRSRAVLVTAWLIWSEDGTEQWASHVISRCPGSFRIEGINHVDSQTAR
jgi:hypothetical protein